MARDDLMLDDGSFYYRGCSQSRLSKDERDPPDGAIKNPSETLLAQSRRTVAPGSRSPEVTGARTQVENA
jgi:hypothetical protein